MALTELIKENKDDLWLFSTILFGIFVAIKISQYAIGVYKFRQFTKAKGGGEVKRYKTWESGLGIRLGWTTTQNSKARKMLEGFQKLHQKIGNTFAFYLFTKRIYITTDPENVKTVMAAGFDDFEHGPVRRNGLGPYFPQGILAVDGHQWSEARQLLRPSFARTEVYNTALLETHFQNFLKQLPQEQFTSIDAQPVFKWLMMDIVTEMLFGSSTKLLAPEAERPKTQTFSYDFYDSIDYLLKQAVKNRTLGRLAKLLPNERARRLLKNCHDTTDRFVQLALGTRKNVKKTKEEQVRQNFLDHLSEKTMDLSFLRDQSLCILVAGTDTTASTLSSLFHVLSRRPEIWAKLREEALTLQGETLAPEQMRALPYLKQVINESLRMHPAIPINQRYSNKDTVIPHGGGPNEDQPLAIPQGTSVYIPVYALHRRKDIFGDDAEEFVPERWDREYLKNPGWGFIPFGGGPRLCIGQEFAMIELQFILIRMLQEFESIENADPYTWKENLSITLDSASGCKMRLKRATPATTAAA